MSRWLKIALAVSVALNLFAAAAAVTVAVTRARVENQVQAQHRPGRGMFLAVVGSLDPAVRDQVRRSLREHALAARPDFDAARANRRQAIELAAQPTFDPAEVQALLEQSRLAELRGRARLERGAIETLAGLQQKDRQALAPLLLRQGPRFRDRPRPPARAAEP